MWERGKNVFIIRHQRVYERSCEQNAVVFLLQVVEQFVAPSGVPVPLILTENVEVMRIFSCMNTFLKGFVKRSWEHHSHKLQSIFLHLGGALCYETKL